MWANANCGRGLGRRAAVCSLTLLLLAAIRARGADASGAAPPREAGSSALESLFAHWQSRQNDITTARLSYRSFHNSVEGRRTPAQLDQLLGELAHWPTPWILMGDLNLRDDEVLPRFAAAGLEAVQSAPTFPAHDPKVRIDWIGVRGFTVGAVEVPTVQASDHLPLVAELQWADRH